MTSRAGTTIAAALAAVSVVLSAAPRVLLAAGALPNAARPFIWSDVYATYADHLAGGKVPYVDTFFDYPPGIGYVAGVFARSTGGPVPYVVLWSALGAVAAAVVALILARAASPAHALRWWSLSPQLLLYGGANFDVIPVALLVAAVVLARRGRSLAALALLAVGTVVKVFPGVAAPIEIARLRRRSGIAAAVVGATLFAALTLVIAVPSLAAPHPSIEGILYQGRRTNFDSVWGLALGALQAIGVPSAGAIVVVVSAAGMFVTYAYVVARRRAADPVQATVLALLAVMLWTRLYSPQYSLWVVPLLALAGIPLRTFALLSVADVIVFFAVYPLTLVAWVAGDPRATALFGVLTLGIALRHAALIAAWRRLDRP